MTSEPSDQREGSGQDTSKLVDRSIKFWQYFCLLGGLPRMALYVA
jgi:hypothetical protein